MRIFLILRRLYKEEFSNKKIKNIYMRNEEIVNEIFYFYFYKSF